MRELWAEKTKRKVPPATWQVLAGFVVFALLYWYLNHGNFWYSWQDDLPVYAGAVRAFQQGADPYAKAYNGLLFVYPPVVLFAGRALVDVFGDRTWTLFFLLHVICLLLTPFLLARYYLREVWLGPAMATLIFFGESRFTGVMAMYSANIAPTLYFAALLAGVPGIRRNRWGWFYGVVFFAGTIKLTFMILLLLPILAGSRQWWRSIACGAGVAAAYVLQGRLFPVLYRGYKAALVEQVGVHRLYGYGVFGVAASIEGRLHRHIGIEVYALYGVCALAVLAALFLLKQRRADRADMSLWLALVLMAVILVNPRMLAYDAYLALFAAFFVFAEFWQLDGWMLIALLAAIFAPSLVVPHVLRTQTMYGSYELLVIMVAMTLGVWRLRKIAEVGDREASIVEQLEARDEG